MREPNSPISEVVWMIGVAAEQRRLCSIAKIKLWRKKLKEKLLKYDKGSLK